MIRVLSIRQPWPWLIVHGGKDVENRGWATSYRGPFLIHASQGCTADEWYSAFLYVQRFDRQLADRIPERVELPRGVVVARAHLRTILGPREQVAAGSACWRVPGSCAWILGDVVEVPHVALRGQRGLFTLGPDDERRLRAAGALGP